MRECGPGVKPKEEESHKNEKGIVCEMMNESYHSIEDGDDRA